MSTKSPLKPTVQTRLTWGYGVFKVNPFTPPKPVFESVENVVERAISGETKGLLLHASDT